MRALAASIALAAMAGPAQADHVSVMALLAGDLGPTPTLPHADACLVGDLWTGADPAGPATCRAMFETCWDRMHLDPEAGVPENAETRFFLARCSEIESGRYYVLLLDHATEVSAAFPVDLDAAARTGALTRFVRAPEDAATGAAVPCIEQSGFEEDHLLICAAAWRRDALIRSRTIWREERP